MQIASTDDCPFRQNSQGARSCKKESMHELQIKYAHRPGVYKEGRIPCGKVEQEIIDGKQMRASTTTSVGTIAALPGA